MINATQLRELIVIPSLNLLRQFSDDAVELLMFTAAVETQGGTYLKQVNGPALGIYQMEPKTHNDIWINYLRARSDVLHVLSWNFAVPKIPDDSRLIYDLYYATALCRIFYMRINQHLPSCKDVDAIWNYYKLYYNTPLGAAEKDKSIEAYENYVTSH